MKKILCTSLCIAALAACSTGCGIIEDMLEKPDTSNFTYMKGNVDYAYFYDRDEDRDKVGESDVAAALVSAVLSGVFEDNYIDVSTFCVKDMTAGFSLYNGNFRDNPSAKIGFVIEVNAITADDFENEDYKVYTLTKTISLAITYGQHWKVGTPVGEYSYIDLNDYDGGFDGYKQGINEGIKNGWYNKFADDDYFDKGRLASKFQTIYQDYLEHQSASGSAADSGSNSVGWYQVYQDVLMGAQEEMSDSDYYRSYYLPDINSDGIPELVLHLGHDITSASYVVYAYTDGTLHECGAADGSIQIGDSDSEKIRIVSENSENILSADSKTTYISFCYNGYQHTNYFRMTMDYQLELAPYYDSGDEKLDTYDIPGEQMESSDIADLALLQKVAGQ